MFVARCALLVQLENEAYSGTSYIYIYIILYMQYTLGLSYYL